MIAYLSKYDESFLLTIALITKVILCFECCAKCDLMAKATKENQSFFHATFHLPLSNKYYLLYAHEPSISMKFWPHRIHLSKDE